LILGSFISPEELFKAINHFSSLLDSEKEDLRKFGERTREDYFEPITKNAVRNFLRLS